MRRILRLLVAAATLLVVLVAVGFFVYGIGKINSSGERSSEAEYSILRNTLVPMQSKDELNSELFRNRLLSLFQGSERLLAIQILDESGLVLWKIPVTSRYYALPNETSARSGYIVPRSSTRVFSTPLIDGMKLTALYTTFRRSDVSRAAFPSFIMVLVWFIALAIAACFLRKDPGEEPAAVGIDAPADLDEKEIQPEVEADIPTEAPVAEVKLEPLPEPEKAEKAEEVEEGEVEEIEEFEEPASGIGSSWLTSSAKEDTSGKKFEESLARLEEEVREWSSRKPSTPGSGAAPAARIENPPPVSPEPESADDSSVEEIQEELEEMKSFKDERPIPDEAPVSEENEAEADELLKEFDEISAEEKTPQPALEPKPQSKGALESEKRDLSGLPLSLSLQNPALEGCLAEELGRSGADLALILIHCGLASDTDPAAVALSVTLRDYIGSKDLIFELYKGAFAVVLPTVDLGAALKMSEDLADVLSATYSLYRDLEEEAPVYLGISARSNRAVDAFKLYREASTAVHKAYSGGPSKILAFRPKTE
ncbi:MAG: hypothetical protein NT061_01820 [Spirochaetes bacterium]|nr:hypothetical protein [Spirochaetota bacterium]